MEKNQKVYHVETEPKQTLRSMSRGGIDITNLNLDKLIGIVGHETVNRMFTEYFMRLVAKAKSLEEPDGKKDGNTQDYVMVIDGRYVGEMRYCTADDPESLDEKDWEETLHKPIFLGIVNAKDEQAAVLHAAVIYDLNPYIIKALKVSECRQ